MCRKLQKGVHCEGPGACTLGSEGLNLDLGKGHLKMIVVRMCTPQHTSIRNKLGQADAGLTAARVLQLVSHKTPVIYGRASAGGSGEWTTIDNITAVIQI